MLSLHKLEVFYIVVSTGSFSKAAEQLLLSQSAISQHIQSLEASLGTKLFIRGHRGVHLTPAGETLHDYVRCILRLLAEAESAVSDVEHLGSGQLRIGATLGAGMYLLPEWLQPLRHRFPNLSVSMTTDITPQIVTSILQHTLDIGFIEGEATSDSYLGCLDLMEIKQFIVIGPEHPWRSEASVSIQALNNQPFIARPRNSHTRIWLEKLFDEHHIRPNIVAEVDTPETIKQAVISGLGIAIMPEYAVRHEQTFGLIHLVPVQNVDLRRTLRLIWDAQKPFTSTARAFLTHLSERFPQILSLPPYQPIRDSLVIPHQDGIGNV